MEVIRHGTKRPAHVLVRFTDDEFEGLRDWVPPTRLKVPWDTVAEYRAREERWDRLRQACLERDDPRGHAVETVVLALLGDYETGIEHPINGAIRIGKPVELARALGLAQKQLSDHPAAFVEDGCLIVPWEVTELVVTSAARLNPDPVLREVAEDERKAELEAIHGYYARGRNRGDSYISPEICGQVDREFSRPIRDVLRSLVRD